MRVALWDERNLMLAEQIVSPLARPEGMLAKTSSGGFREQMEANF